MSKGVVTINTDASFYREKGIGSFAFWISCDQGKFKLSGILKDRCKRPEIAEFKCIINALHYLSTLSIPDIKVIILNTDCLNVIHLLKKDKKKIKKYGLDSWGNHLKAKFFQIKDVNFKEATIEYRHVKSHVSTASSREWVNDWCDKEAKKHINKWIKQNSPVRAADVAAE